MKQYMVTPAAGKRLIGKAIVVHPAVKRALAAGTVVIGAGTTNGYVAEEVLTAIGQGSAFSRQNFFRGVSLPPSFKTGAGGRVHDGRSLPGDVVIKDGLWQQGKTIFDVLEALREGDIILKGANALDVVHKRAAVLVGNLTGGTIMAAMAAVIGRRVQLIIPVGLEKRIPGDLDELAARVNAPGARGPRLFPMPGEVFTEVDSLALLTGVIAEPIAAGGICGAEGGVWLAVSGTPEQESEADKLLCSVGSEPAFTL